MRFQVQTAEKGTITKQRLQNLININKLISAKVGVATQLLLWGSKC